MDSSVQAHAEEPYERTRLRNLVKLILQVFCALIWRLVVEKSAQMDRLIPKRSPEYWVKASFWLLYFVKTNTSSVRLALARLKP
eukprot:jgi/Chlat1/7496/Chrsp61S07013